MTATLEDLAAQLDKIDANLARMKAILDKPKARYFRRNNGVIYRLTGDSMDVRGRGHYVWVRSVMVLTDMEPLGAVEITEEEGEPS